MSRNKFNERWICKTSTPKHKISQQEIQEDLHKWRHQYCKLIYRFKAISIKVLADFYEEI